MYDEKALQQLCSTDLTTFKDRKLYGVFWVENEMYGTKIGTGNGNMYTC